MMTLARKSAKSAEENGKVSVEKMRLIDADALFAEFENVGWYNNADRDEIAEPLILQSPTIDAVEVVRGEWIDEHENGHGFWVGVCSQCGEEKLVDNFCPNCGAKMDGERKESE